jgi:hypothetical protein
VDTGDGRYLRINNATDHTHGDDTFVDALPKGVVVVWSGPVPWGWALCDGTKGTPDLRTQFTGKLKHLVYIQKT